jgi:hypothetical protein
VGAPADTAIATAINGTGTQTRGALEASFSPAIFPSTAAADGTTDDTAAIQAAVDSCPVGGVVDGHGLTYLVSSVLLKSDMEFRNFNLLTKPGTTDFVSPVTIGAYSDTTTRSNIKIRNVHVDGQRTGQTGIGSTEDGGRHGFRLLGPIVNLLMEDCTAVNCASDGLTIYRGTGMTAITSYSTGIKSKLRFVRCSFTGNRRHGVSVDTATDGKFEDCKFTGNGLNADGSITPGSSTDGAMGAIMPSVGGLYGNGVDLEEYDLKSYVGDVTFVRCTGTGNAKSGILAYSGPMLASDANFVTRKGYRFTGCTLDAGISAASDGFGLSITPPVANKALGWYYDDVDITDCTISGQVTLRSVKTARHSGGSVTPASGNYIGTADTVDSLKVAVPTRGTKRYSLNAVNDLRYSTDPESIWIGPATLVNIGGGPVLGNTSFVPTWAIRDGFTDRLGCTVILPADWERGHVDLYWANASAATGDVLWRCDSQVISTTIADSASGPTVLATAGAQNAVMVTRVATNRSTVAAGLLGLELVRLGTDGTDTLAGSVLVLGLKITRAL